MAIKECLLNGKKCFEVYVNGHDQRGRRIQRRKTRVETKAKAEKIEFELKRELAQIKEQRVPFRWHEWFDECMKRMRLEFMPSTVATYQQLLKWVHPHWRDKEIHTITKNDCYELIYHKCEKLPSQFTRRNILKMVKRLFQMAVEEGLIDRNPFAGIVIRVAEVEQKVLTNVEVETFLREARLSYHRFYPVWLMALMTGMRSGEMFALKWSDIDLDAKTISVTKQWTSKNGICATKSRKTRVVPISEDLSKFLKEYKLRSDYADHVLPRLSEWEHGEQSRVTREFCVGIGITAVKFHDLRATFITNLLARGESLARVMSMVGHSEIKTTNGYLRKAGVDVQGGTDKLGYKVPIVHDGNIIQIVGRQK